MPDRVVEDSQVKNSHTPKQCYFAHFLLLVSKRFPQLPANVQLLMYVDDITIWRHQLQLFLDGNTLPTTEELKNHCATFDHSLTFHEHVKQLNQSCLKLNNAPKAVSSQNQGLKKKELLVLFKATTPSCTHYASPIWTPNLAHTHWKQLRARNFLFKHRFLTLL